MITADSLTTVVEGVYSDETFSLKDSISEEEQPRLPPEESLFTEQNSDSRDETLGYHLNGGSTTLDTDLGQLLFFPPQPRAVKEYFKALQKWKGVVVEVRQDTFLAQLVSIDENSSQEAEIYIEEVGQEDRTLIESGAVFYWTIGYLNKPSGTLGASIIRFRRLPTWTKRELEVADAKANDLRELFDVQ